MADRRQRRVYTLVQRELRENRSSLCWTPLAIAAGLTVVMLLSVLLAKHISALGDAVTELIPPQNTSNISIRIDNSSGDEPTIEYRVEQREPLPAPAASSPTATAGPAVPGRLNPLLNSVHNLFLLILMLVSANYLLATLYTDRRDRSILFWKSMPVSEWEEVLSKFGVAILVVPLLYAAASLLAQVICILLSMVLMWRMELDPYELILGNLDFSQLLIGQLRGWVLMTLWIAPTYAWLLLASAAARRSPFMLAVAPLIVLVLLEGVVSGTAHLAALLRRHLPHYGDGNFAGFYWLGMQDIPALLLGLLCAGAALWAAVYLRRYRFEI